MLRFKVLFPPTRHRDAVSRIFKQGDIETPIPKDQPELVFEVEEGDDVHLELADVDKAGNVMTPLTYDFVATSEPSVSLPGQMLVVFEGGDQSVVEEDDSTVQVTEGITKSPQNDDPLAKYRVS